MGDDWTHVRIRRETHALLARMIDSRQETFIKGHMTAWWNSEDGPTFDEMIAYLVAHVQRDRKRSLTRLRDRASHQPASGTARNRSTTPSTGRTRMRERAGAGQVDRHGLAGQSTAKVLLIESSGDSDDGHTRGRAEGQNQTGM